MKVSCSLKLSRLMREDIVGSNYVESYVDNDEQKGVRWSSGWFVLEKECLEIDWRC